MARYYDPNLGWVTVEDDGAIPSGGFSSMEAASEFDPYNAILMRSRKFVPDTNPELWDYRHVSGAEGNRFKDAMDYYTYLYGPGVTQETTPDGNIWYRTPNGADAFLPGRTPVSYNPPDSKGFGLTLAAIAAMVGAGAMNGAFSSPVGTSGFDLPMGDFGGSWNLGTTVAPEGASAAASLPEAASPMLSSDPLWNVQTFGHAPGGASLPAGGGPTVAAAEAAFGAGSPLGGSMVRPGLSFLDQAFPGAVELAGPTPLGSAAGTAGTAANAAQAGSALSRFLGGNSTTQDNLSLLGNLAGTGLGLLGARQQSRAMGDIASQYSNMGAPYRSLLQQSYQPGFSMANQPDFQNAMDVGAQAAARATSAKVGNPVDNPGAYAEMQKYITGSLALPQLNTYRSQLGTFGQFGVNQAGTAQMGQAQAQSGMYDALGYGIGQMTQPDNPFKGLLDQFRNQTINSTRSF